MTFTIQDPEQGSPQYPTLMGLVGTLKGYDNWSGPIDHIGLSSSTRFAHVTRNLSTGGHQQWKKSTGNSEVAAVTDAGFRTTAFAASGNATVAGTLGVTGAITGSSTVQGTQLISTVATGTAPLTVASTTVVPNLNADLLDGQHASAFLTQTTGDARYLQLTGGTLSGLLTLEASTPTARVLKIKYGSSSGGFFLGATNSADPSLQLSDDSGNIMALVNPSGSTYALDVNPSTPATNAARFAGDVLITTDLGVNDINATGAVTAVGMNTSATINISGSSSIDGNGGTAGQLRIGAVIVNAASLSGSEKLFVDGGMRIEDSGSARIETNGTGLGFFSAPPISRPTVTGSRGGNAALLSLITAIENLGLILNSTTV